MESAVFNLIEDLDQSTTNWKIKARVTRMWTIVSSENGSVKGYNVILLDDNNNHVHAFAYPNIWNGFKNPVIEGGVYVFDQFSVKDAVGNLKPVQADICIRFSQYTTVTIVEDDGMIPAYKFEFLDLGDLFAEASKYQPQQQHEFAIDVIGVIEDFEPLTKLDTKFGMRDIVKFRICDFRLKEEGYLAKREKYLKAAKSKFVQTFMERMTLKDLNEKLTYDDLKKRIYTTFSVFKVDEDVAWFRIMVLAADDTFSCNVMLMDRAARRIVGTSAAKAYNDFENAPEEGLPRVLKDLVGKEVTVIIQLNKANVTEDSTIFDANNIFDTTIRSPSPSESAHISESSSINFSVNEK
ncbi:uncharacterized protein LOC141665075 [Apium graveolens]|uniref:uncharacterized protein LOC141665075 n=1 Tax=Apium graveolens TaxID=4045 RepID=UPI003D79E32D